MRYAVPSVPMRPALPLFRVLLVLALLATGADAWAQTTPSVSGILGAVQRLEPNGTSADDPNTGHPHPSGVLVSAVNFEDCEFDIRYQFQLGITYPSSSYSLEVWAGSQDCSQLTNRQTSATAVCWPVAYFQPALTNPTLVTVRVQDIISGAFTTMHNTSFTPATNTNDTVCQPPNAQTGALNLTLYFFFVDGSSNPVGNDAQYPIRADVRAGDVQGDISVGQGDTLLLVNIPPTTDPDTQEWNVYTDPPVGGESALSTVPIDAPTNNGLCAAQVPDTGVIADAGDGASAGATDAAGTMMLDDAGGNACGAALNNAGIPSPGSCSASSVITQGAGQNSTLIPVVDEAGVTIYEDGGTSSTTTTGEGGTSAIQGGLMKIIPSNYLRTSGSASSTQLIVKGLQDGVFYNVAVAAVDGVGNVGPLSNVVCGEPVPVSDFWDRYWEAGGRAGGFCSVDRVGRASPPSGPTDIHGVAIPAGTTGIAVVMASGIMALIRRRRRS